MHNTNSKVYAAVSVTVLPDTPLEISITQDGILDIYPIQWTDTDIPVVVFIKGSESWMPYVDSTIYPNSDLGTFCIQLSSDFETIHIEGITNLCETTTGYYKGTFMIPGSALPEPTETFIQKTCDPENPFRERFRKAGYNAKLTMSGSITALDSTVYALTGESAAFTVIRNDNYYDFRKTSENMTLTDLLKGYMPVNWIYNSKSDNFFDSYLSGMLGGDSPHHLNVSIPAGIHNVFPDLFDIDTCTIKTLYSNASMMGEAISIPFTPFPSELERAMHLVSIPHDKIFGHMFDPNIDRITGKNNYTSLENLFGDVINKKEVIQKEKQILYQKKGEDAYYAYFFDSDDIGLTYEQSLSSYFLNNTSVTIDSVCLYEIVPAFLENKGSVIDYDNPDNKLDYYSNDEWIKDRGIAEEVLSYILHKNLE